MKIITHTSPDWDAIGAAWLVKRFLLPDAEIVCMGMGEITRNRGIASAIVDCGGEYDPALLRFDHHHLGDNETCAMWQVWQHLGQGVDYLEPIVMLIYAGDVGASVFGAGTSRRVGLHAQLAARKEEGWSDAALIQWGCQELDLLVARLIRQQQARVELAERCVWESADGKIVAIEDGEPRHSQAAYAAGATLVVFRGDVPTERGVTYSVGISRNMGAEFPHIGELLAASMIDGEAERDGWFRHPAGFFAGRGTPKTPRQDPVPSALGAGAIARAIDAAWERGERADY